MSARDDQKPHLRARVIRLLQGMSERELIEVQRLATSEGVVAMVDSHLNYRNPPPIDEPIPSVVSPPAISVASCRNALPTRFRSSRLKRMLSSTFRQGGPESFGRVGRVEESAQERWRAWSPIWQSRSSRPIAGR